MDFASIFLEYGEKNAQAASNMISNVSIAYNAADASQRNAVFQAQSKISKAQKRKEKSNLEKEKHGFTATESANPFKDSMLEFSSIFYESEIVSESANKPKEFETEKKKVLEALSKISNSGMPNSDMLKQYRFCDMKTIQAKTVLERMGYTADTLSLSYAGDIYGEESMYTLRKNIKDGGSIIVTTSPSTNAILDLHSAVLVTIRYSKRPFKERRK